MKQVRELVIVVIALIALITIAFVFSKGWRG